MFLQEELGQWNFKSKGNDAYYEGHMFPLHVKEQLDLWPEKHIRQRVWVSLKFKHFEMYATPHNSDCGMKQNFWLYA